MTTELARGVKASPPSSAHGGDGHQGDPMTAPPLSCAEGRPAPRAIDLTPGSPEWCRRVTASKVAAILGVSPWTSQRAVWHQLRGELPTTEATTAQRRGLYLEPAILAWWRDQHGLDEADLVTQPCYTLGDWAAATPDAVAQIDGRAVLVEAKSARDPDEWGVPGTDVIPTHYLTQCYWAMHVSGVTQVRVAVLGAYLEFAEYVVDYDDTIGADLEARCKAFYDSTAADTPPPLDGSRSTLECLRRVHPDIDRRTSVDVPGLAARRWLAAKGKVDAAEFQQRLRTAVLLEAAGRAQYLTAGGVTFARRQPGKGGTVSLYRIPGVSAKDIPLTDEELEEEAAQ